MADTAERMLRLLGLLQARARWSGVELAARLGRSERTLRRDVERLRRLDYPVEADPGPGGGYRLGRGGRLPPLLFDEDETVAVALGLQAAADAGVAGIDDAVSSALAKLERFLPAHLAARVRDLDEASETLWGRDPDPVDRDLLVTLAGACRRGEQVRLDYCDRAGNATSRLVDPHRLVRAGRRWYLVARDTKQGAWRTFRVDRAEAVTLSGNRVELGDPPDALRLVSEAMGLAPYAVKARVRLALSVEEAAKVVPRTVGVLSADGEAATIVELGGPHLAGMVGYLAALSVPCEVLGPDELRTALRAHGEHLAQVNR